jgi:hypothetical protein
MEKEMVKATEPESGTPEYGKHLVREVMNEIIRRIDDRTMSAERILELRSACDIWLSEDGIGLQPILPWYWKEMDRVNELTDIGFDEMVHEGLDLYWQTNDLEDYEEEEESEDEY